MPHLSVILPSHNGEDTLPACLRALGKVRRPEGGAEFILVDNRSTDDTGRLLRDAAATLPGTVLSEPRPGKSHALNTAIAAARGDLLVFTDDDVLPDPDWLVAFAEAAEAHPDVGIFAGQIRPCWGADAPGWLATLADRGLVGGCTPADQTAGPYSEHRVKGANMMVRASLLRGRGFDTGRVNFVGGGAATGGEDSKLVHDLVAAGERVRYVPGARLRHILQPEETTLRFLLSRQVRIGRGNAAITPLRPHRAAALAAGLVGYAVLAPLLWAAGGRASGVHQAMKAARRFGMLGGWFGRKG